MSQREARWLWRGVVIVGIVGLAIGWMTAPWVWSSGRSADGTAIYGWSNMDTGAFVGIQVP